MNQNKILSGIPHESISQRARELWQQKGAPDGQDLAIWLEAESRLSGQLESRSDGIDHERLQARLDAFGNTTPSRSPTSLNFT